MDRRKAGNTKKKRRVNRYCSDETDSEEVQLLSLADMNESIGELCLMNHAHHLISYCLMRERDDIGMNEGVCVISNKSALRQD